MGNGNKARENHVIGRGDIFFAERRADGTYAGERLLGNTPAFSISVQSENVKHYSSARGVRTQDREVPVQTDYSGMFETDDVSPKNLALLFLGTAASTAVTSGAGLTETFKAVETGLFYQVGITPANPMGLQKVTVASVKIGTTALVVNVDYKVDNDLGRIELLEGGTLTDGVDIIVTYSNAAYTQDRVVAGSTVKEGRLRFVAYNPEGDDQDYLLPLTKLSPNGDVAIKSDNDWTKLPFKIAISSDASGIPVYVNGRAWTPAA